MRDREGKKEEREKESDERSVYMRSLKMRKRRKKKILDQEIENKRVDEAHNQRRKKRTLDEWARSSKGIINICEQKRVPCYPAISPLTSAPTRSCAGPAPIPWER